MFCNNIVEVINNIPFPVPIVAITDDIVYPMQYPLYPITKYIIGTPITVEPKNQSKMVMQKLLITDVVNNFVFEIW